MSQVLKLMPDTIVPYLSENNKLDLIDFMDSNMKAEVRNQFEGKTELTLLTDDFASLTLNEATQLDMRLLTVSEPVDSASQIICLVSTYGSDARDSEIDFYSLKWRKLDATKYIQHPAQMFTAQLDSQQAQMVLTISNFTERPANEEQKETEKMSFSLNWDGKRFK
ncbi:MAG: DUF3256 family protein [Prevotella sp.]|nr:DUF3256 family protein [Prevotella sp.]